MHTDGDGALAPCEAVALGGLAVGAEEEAHRVAADEDAIIRQRDHHGVDSLRVSERASE